MDEKIKELIAIGASICAHCQPCLSYHVGKAHEAGLTDDEIREAIDVGRMVEKGAMSAMHDFSGNLLDNPSQSSAAFCARATCKTDKKCCG